MHDKSDPQKTLHSSNDATLLKWRAYTQIGAGLTLFLLLAAGAATGDGSRRDNGAAVKIAAAPAQTAGATAVPRDQPADARANYLELGSKAPAERSSADVLAATER